MCRFIYTKVVNNEKAVNETKSLAYNNWHNAFTHGSNWILLNRWEPRKSWSHYVFWFCMYIPFLRGIHD